MTNYPSRKFLLVYCLACLLIMSLIESPGLISEQAGLIHLVDFDAHKPFVYRALLPALLHVAVSVTPDVIKQRIDSFAWKFIERKGKQIFAGAEPEKVQKLRNKGYMIVLFEALNFVVLLGYLIMLGYLAATLKIGSGMIPFLLPLGMAAIIPTYFNYLNYAYDFAVLFFFTTGLLLMALRRWRLYLLVLFFALWNKETAALLVLIFAIHFARLLPKQLFWRLLLIQLAMVVGVKAMLAILFWHNAGPAVDWHVERNIGLLQQISTYFHFRSIGRCLLFPRGLGVPLPRGLNIPVFSLVLVLIVVGWRKIPLLLRHSLIIAPVLLVLGFFTCFIDELRSFYEALPVAYLAAVAGLLSLLGRASTETML